MQRVQLHKRRNLMLTLMYDGTDYNGWQRQKSNVDNKVGIQGMIESILSDMLQEDIQIIGSGRTDAGVHAIGQVCNFYTTSNLEETEIMTRLNQSLPEDVKATAISTVNERFHSRYDAVSKTYEYRFDERERESVFQRKYTYPTFCKLNIEKMQEAAKYLVGTHDFKAFATDRKDGKSTIRTITEIRVYRIVDEKNLCEVRVECTGDGFLHHMIRIIAGTLLEVGKGERTPESVKAVLDLKQRSKAGILLYPQGLFLKQVSYK